MTEEESFTKWTGYCPRCKRFYPHVGRPFEKCPKNHPLLHPCKCQKCEITLFFQCDDDHCGPYAEWGIYCGACALKEDVGE